MARIDCEADNHTFFIKKIVINLWYLVHVDSAQHQNSALAKRPERGGNNFTGGRQKNSGTQVFPPPRPSSPPPLRAPPHPQTLVPRLPPPTIDFYNPPARPPDSPTYPLPTHT